MKLVDILARVLKEWPKNVIYIFQDYDKELRYSGCGPSRSDVYLSELADSHRKRGDYTSEYEYECVTQAEWQAAVNALKAGSAPAWVGIGVPPAGTVCNLKTKGGTSHVAEIMYSSETAVVWRWKSGGSDEFGSEWDEVEVSLIRAPEQIAAEEREEAINAMELLGVGNPSRYDLLAALYDAGYRKFEIVDN